MAEAQYALSLTQPWATLVAVGAKTLETRSWGTDYRGPLAIHASKRWIKEDRALVYDEPFNTALWKYGFDNQPLGVVLAIVDLVYCYPIVGVAGIPPEPELSFGNYEFGRYVWRLENVRRLAVPIPAKGSLGLWEWTPPEGWHVP